MYGGTLSHALCSSEHDLEQRPRTPALALRNLVPCAYGLALPGITGYPAHLLSPSSSPWSRCPRRLCARAHGKDASASGPGPLGLSQGVRKKDFHVFADWLLERALEHGKPTPAVYALTCQKSRTVLSVRLCRGRGVVRAQTETYSILPLLMKTPRPSIPFRNLTRGFTPLTCGARRSQTPPGHPNLQLLLLPEPGVVLEPLNCSLWLNRAQAPVPGKCPERYPLLAFLECPPPHR